MPRPQNTPGQPGCRRDQPSTPSGGQRDRQQVPVDQRRGGHAGRRGQHHGVPRPVRSTDRTWAQTAISNSAPSSTMLTSTKIKRRRRPAARRSGPALSAPPSGCGDHPLQLEEPAGQHRVLQHRVVAGVQVGRVALHQPALGVEERRCRSSTGSGQVGTGRPRLPARQPEHARRPGRPGCRSAGRPAPGSTSRCRAACRPSGPPRRWLTRARRSASVSDGWSACGRSVPPSAAHRLRRRVRPPAPGDGLRFGLARRSSLGCVDGL